MATVGVKGLNKCNGFLHENDLFRFACFSLYTYTQIDISICYKIYLITFKIFLENSATTSLLGASSSVQVESRCCTSSLDKWPRSNV